MCSLLSKSPTVAVDMSRVGLVLLVLCSFVFSVHSDYWADRHRFIEHEQSMAVGSKLAMTAKEQAVNKILMEAKHSEIDYAFHHPETFPPARHFFDARNDIEKSKVFSLIRQMPKGGALHIHDTALVSTDYLLRNITYRDNLYACIEGEKIQLVFAKPPPEGDCWKSMKLLREESENVEDFDAWLKSKLTLVIDNPEEAYPDINAVWQTFVNIFGVVTPMLTYRPVWRDYFYEVLREFYDDNVKYLEIRSTLPKLYELNGTTYDRMHTLGALKEVAQEFINDHPLVLGVKCIYAPSREVNVTVMEDYISTFKEMKAKYPNFLVGFDLVGQEDRGEPLKEFIQQLEGHRDEIKFFFHSGETNWNGMSTDMNLVDAILLNTTRIGHGFAIVKHPAVMQEVKKRGIPIEVNPISNQVLALVKDLRNHPVNQLIAEGFPIVISSDDPGFWGALPLSHDFYETFMGLASREADLRMLKQLSMNSLLYSSLSSSAKTVAFKKWQLSWEKFIGSVLENQYSPASVLLNNKK